MDTLPSERPLVARIALTSENAAHFDRVVARGSIDPLDFVVLIIWRTEQAQLVSGEREPKAYSQLGAGMSDPLPLIESPRPPDEGCGIALGELLG